MSIAYYLIILFQFGSIAYWLFFGLYDLDMGVHLCLFVGLMFEL